MYYGKLLTCEEKEHLDVEVAKWKKCYERMPIQERPKAATSAFPTSALQTFPGLHKSVEILLLLQLVVFLVNGLSLLSDALKTVHTFYDKGET